MKQTVQNFLVLLLAAFAPLIGSNLAKAQSRPATAEDVNFEFRYCLGRAPTADETKSWLAQGASVDKVRDTLCSQEDGRRHRIKDLYKSCLSREPNDEEIQGWLKFPYQELAGGICRSIEAQRVKIAKTFKECLLRDPTLEELEKYMKVPPNDRTWEICNTPEGIRRTIEQLYLKCVERPATFEEVEALIKKGYGRGKIYEILCKPYEIKKQYLDCLGRQPTEKELKYWVDKLDDKYRRIDVCETPEGKRYSAAKAYRECLKREASPEELDFWQNVEYSTAGIRTSICTSDEAKLLK